MRSATRVMIAPSTNRCDGMQIGLVAFMYLPSSAPFRLPWGGTHVWTSGSKRCPQTCESAVPAEPRLEAAQPFSVHLDELIHPSSDRLRARFAGTLRTLRSDPEVRMSWEDAGNATRVLIVDDHDLFRTGL